MTPSSDRARCRRGAAEKDGATARSLHRGQCALYRSERSNRVDRQIAEECVDRQFTRRKSSDDRSVVEQDRRWAERVTDLGERAIE